MDGLDLKIARLRAGVRGYELARHVGLSESALSRIETGRRLADPDELARLVAAIDALTAPGRAAVGAGSPATREVA